MYDFQRIEKKFKYWISMAKDIVLTGDRPTGPLHLGHYVGSLKNRLLLQDKYKQLVMIADAQALTDHADRSYQLRENIFEVMLDYLAVGIDPKKTIIFIQSMLPQLSELTEYYMNLVTVSRVSRNPTVKTEIQQKKFGQSIPVGFFVYPISQAADITAFKATMVPVGQDQLPMIEQTNEIVRAFNRTYDSDVLVECKAITPKVASRLPGIDGKAKMSKTLGNAIYLSDPFDIVAKKVKAMYTDPDHIRVEDPGKIEGNTVFAYLDAFDPDTQKVKELKEQYQKGGLGDMKVKNYLLEVLESILKPIRIAREEYAKDPAHIINILKEGTEKAESIAQKTLREVKEAMHLNYW